MSLFDIYKAIKVGRSDSLFASIVGGKLNKDAWKKGFNKWDEEWELGSISNSTGQDASSTTSIRSKNYIHVLPGTKYYFKCPSTIGLRYYDENKDYVDNNSAINQTKTMPSTVHYIRFAISGITTYSDNICINISGEHDGEYVPYNG